MVLGIGAVRFFPLDIKLGELGTSTYDLIDLANMIGLKGLKIGPKNIDMSKDGPYILNIDDLDGSGTHWIGFYRRGKDIQYFDPFGLEPLYEVLNLPGIKNIEYNSEEVQSRKSSTCGIWCLYVLLQLQQDVKTLNDIIHDCIRIGEKGLVV